MLCDLTRAINGPTRPCSVLQYNKKSTIGSKYSLSSSNCYSPQDAVVNQGSAVSGVMWHTNGIFKVIRCFIRKAATSGAK